MYRLPNDVKTSPRPLSVLLVLNFDENYHDDATSANVFCSRQERSVD